MRVLSLLYPHLGHSSLSPKITIYARSQLEMLTKVGNTGREASDKKALLYKQQKHSSSRNTGKKASLYKQRQRERVGWEEKGQEKWTADSEEQLSCPRKCRPLLPTLRCPSKCKQLLPNLPKKVETMGPSSQEVEESSMERLSENEVKEGNSMAPVMAPGSSERLADQFLMLGLPLESEVSAKMHQEYYHH